LGEDRLDDRWLSVDEICAHLGISRDTVYKWIDKKKLPAHRVGRLWKFMKAEVDEWVRAGGSESKKGGARADDESTKQ
jgi:excisionase family DNA binding protein